MFIPLFCVLLACALTAVPAAADPGDVGDLYVSSDVFDVVAQYDGITGVKELDFASSVGGPSQQMAIHFGGPNHNMLVGHASGGVLEVDGETGTPVRLYNPGGGWQWAGIWAPNGNVYIGDQNTNDVREYDSSTGAFVRVLCDVDMPADMEYGPDGNLYICSNASFVRVVDPVTGDLVDQWNTPGSGMPNDIVFLENEILVTEMSFAVVMRFDYDHNYLGNFSGTDWGITHGIAVSPHDGNLYVVDGLTTQVHVFDPVTYAELDAGFLNPNPGSKIVDLCFKPAPEAPGTVSAGYLCEPNTGTLPFTTNMTVTLTNNYLGQTRRIAGRINVALAGGMNVSNWRGGYTNVAAGDSYVASWNQGIPALASVVGTNTFTVVAEDVTPSPYNQPPYPAAGDTDSGVCAIYGVAP
jgi:hypothetical protein